MYKMTVSFDDLNGDTITQDVYFNFSKMEALRIQSKEGGFAQHIERILVARDMESLISTFEWFVQEAYGERTADGSMFVKYDEEGNRLIDKFKLTPAYDEVLYRLCSSEDESAAFVNGVIPSDMVKQVTEEAQKASLADA